MRKQYVRFVQIENDLVINVFEYENVRTRDGKLPKTFQDAFDEYVGLAGPGMPYRLEVQTFWREE